MAVLYVYLLSYDFNRLKPDIIASVKKTTGRNLVINGDIRIAIGLFPSLLVEGVSLENAEWSSRPRMLQVKRFELQLALLPLVTGTLEVRKAALINSEIFLEVNPKGILNLPDFGARSATPESEDESGRFYLPQIALKNVSIINSRLFFKGRLATRPVTLRITRLRLKSSAPGGAARLDMAATYNKQPLTAKGSVGSVNKLLDPEKPWPLDLTVSAVGSKLALAGTIHDALKGSGFALDFKLTSRDVSRTTGVAGFKLPLKTGARVTGHLSGALANEIKLSQLKLQAGRNKLEGFVLAKLKSGKPYFNVTLTSKRLDLRPADSPKAAAKVKQASPPPARKLFPARAFPAGFLRKANADVGLRVKQCLFARSALQDLKLNLSLKNGRLTLKPITAVVGSGKLRASATLREIRKKLVVRAALDIANLNAERMLRELDIADALEGEFDISAALAGQGASVAEIMAGANGHLSVIMGNGRFHNRLLAVAGGDLQAGLFDLLAPGDQSHKLTEINCMVTRFDITDGIANTRVLVMDTQALRAIGKGSINLKSEKLDISLNPIPTTGVGTDAVGKIHLSLGSLTKPFKLGGTLANPSLAIDAKRAALTLGKAFGGFALFGPFGLATLLVDGDASKKDLCKTAVAIARQKRPPSKKVAPADSRKKKKRSTDPGSFLDGLKKMFK